MKRFNLLESRDQRFDIIVIGGGLTGTAAARDAAMRGYRTILLEKDDFGSGSTCRGAHSMAGNPTFAQRGDLRLQRQLEQERQIQMHIAPHLYRPLDSVFLFIKDRKSPGGLKRGPLRALQEWLLPEGAIGRLLSLPAKQLSFVHPGLKADLVECAYMASDSAVDSPVRLCLENLLSANNHGAVAANYAKVLSIQVHNRQVQGVTLEDRISGKSLRVNGRCIINAAGPWMDQICRMADDRFISSHRVLQETYAVVPQLDPPLEKALWFSSTQDGRFIEVLPWLNYLVLGPVIENAGQEVDAPRSDSRGINALFSEVRQLLPSLALPEEAVWYARTGLSMAAADAGRPGIARGHPPWVVDHARVGGPKGLLSAVGARLFNYRRIAQQVVDAARPHAGTPEKGGCQSHMEPLYGGNIQSMTTFVEEVTHAARNYALSDSQVRHLVSLYGNKAQEIFQWLKNHPDLNDAICPHQPDIKAQLLYSIDREMAVSVGDVLLRRTLIGLTGCRGLDCVQTVASTLARHLGWSDARVQAEIANYRDELHRIFWTG